MLKVKNITIGYSDSEDRLWFKLTLFDEKDVQIWITRQLAKNICKELTRLLKFHSKEKLTYSDLDIKKEIFEMNNAIWDKSSSKSLNENNKSLLGLCKNIEIILFNNNWKIVMRVSHEQKFFFITSRINIIKLFIAIIQQIKFANWDINNFDDYFR